jgi:uncharacterized protein
MSKKILVDTSAIIGYFFETETSYEAILEYVQSHPEEQWVILSTVFSETMTWFRARSSSEMTISIGEKLRSECIYINLSRDDDAQVWALFKRYSDKLWSYTDCSLLAMSQSLNIPRILTIDHHFLQMLHEGIIVCPI